MAEKKNKAGSSLALRRMATLEMGGLTDCTFLVGPDGNPNCLPQEIRACKFDLMASSEYFQGLLRSPLTPPGPIRIKHVEPEIFNLVIEFTHTCGHLVSEVSDLEQCVKLSAAADEFLLEELGQLCTEKLEKLINVDNVWTVFDQNHSVKFTSCVCKKLLGTKTEECLQQAAFRQIDEKTLAVFLNMDKMSIKSEMELVMACLGYIKGRDDERALFRRCALPHLRLLTLSADDDLSQLAPFLDKDEKMFLTLNLHMKKDPLELRNDLPEDTSLCSNAEKRELLTRNIVLDLVQDKSSSRSKSAHAGFKLVGKCYNWKRNDYMGSTFTLTLTAKSPIRITGFDILCQVEGEIEGDVSSEEDNSSSEEDVSSTKSLKVKDAVAVWKNTRVTSSSSPLDRETSLSPSKIVEYCAHFETTIALNEGDKAWIKVKFDEPCYIANALLASTFINGNSDLICSTLHKQYQQHIERGGLQLEPKYVPPSKQYTVFKSVYYQGY